jgi:hypothetical protein
MAVFRIEKTQNYTVMSNHHLRNTGLSLKAKGLLSQMLSLPDDWDYTLAGLSKINRERIDAIRTAVWELEKAGYIVRQQSRDARGKMAATCYTIYEQPQEPESPLPSQVSPSLDFPTSVNPSSVISTSENPTQLNKEKLNKEKSNTDLSNTYSIPILSPRVREASPERKGMDGFEAYREIIKVNIDYDIITERHKLDKTTIGEIVDLMLETVCSAKKHIRIAGDDYPTELVKQKLLKLNHTHIEFVIDCMKNNTSDIRNIKKYMLACLFNAPSTIDTYYTALVAHDMAHEPI